MKPRTKFQKLVVEIKLPAITNRQKTECIALFKHVAIRTKTKGTTCLECGHTWNLGQDTTLLYNSIDVKCTCPKCKMELEIQDTRKRKFWNNDILSCHMIHDGMQVLRYYEIEQILLYGEPAKYNIHEVIRCFITPEGKTALMGKLSANSYYSKSYFSLHTDLEIRENLKNYYINCNTSSTSKLIPELYRNGFDGDLRNFVEIQLFTILLSNNIMETLWKTGQYDMFKRFIDSPSDIVKLWPALKVCYKNKYHINDWYHWKDYIFTIIYFQKDITNAYYACPKDLKQAHDIWMKRKKKADVIASRAERLKKLAQQEIEYQKIKSKYLDIEFSNDTIKVKVLQSVNEFYELGEYMNHCIYNRDYYKKTDTLILSATINDEPIETIEIDLKKKTILQCRGRFNSDSQYHKEIKELVNNNINTIKYEFKSRASRKRQLA